jgi:uncharacterized protein YoxC
MKKSILIIASACLVLVVTLASTKTKTTATIAKEGQRVETTNNGRMLEDRNQFN